MAIAAEVAEEEAVLAKAAKRKVGGGIAGAARARRAAAAAATSASGSGANAARASVGGTSNASSPIWGLYSRIADLFRERFAVVRGLASDAEDSSVALNEAWEPMQRRLEILALAGTSPYKCTVLSTLRLSSLFSMAFLSRLRRQCDPT
jgi:hypothetical protein